MIPGFDFILEKIDRTLGVLYCKNDIRIPQSKSIENLEYEIKILKRNLEYEISVKKDINTRLIEQVKRSRDLETKIEKLKTEIEELNKHFNRFDILDL